MGKILQVGLNVLFKFNIIYNSLISVVSKNIDLKTADVFGTFKMMVSFNNSNDGLQEDFTFCCTKVL